MQQKTPLIDIPYDRLPAPDHTCMLFMEPCVGMTRTQWVTSWCWLDTEKTVFLGTRYLAGGKKHLGCWYLEEPRKIGGGLSVLPATEGFAIARDDMEIAHFETLEKAVHGMLALAIRIWPWLDLAGNVADNLTTACKRLRSATATGRTFVRQSYAIVERRPFQHDFLDVTTVFCRLFDGNGKQSDAPGRRSRKITVTSKFGGFLFEIKNSRDSSLFKGNDVSKKGFKTIYEDTAEEVYRRVLKRLPPFLSPHLTGHEVLALAEFIRSETELISSGEPFLIPRIEFETRERA